MENGTRYIESVALHNNTDKLYSKKQIIDWIKAGHTFYPSKNGKRGEKVRIVNGKTMKYLRSEPDDIEEDNLGELEEIKS